MRPLDLRRYRAERLLRKDFEGMRAKVLTVVRSQLRGQNIALAAADLEACYAQAWHGLYAEVLAGEQIENPAGWLVRVTFRRAVDEHRAAGATRVRGEGEGSYPPQSDVRQDLAAELDDKARLRALFEGLRVRMGPREREAVSLCYLQGLTRAQAAERMGVSEARMRKLMEGAGPGREGVNAKLGELLNTIAAGGWCEQQGSLMKAYAFGLLDPDGERNKLAVAHCRECPACRAHVASLRGLASVLPLPLLPGLGGAGSGVATRRSAPGGRGKGRWDVARRAVAGASRKLGGGLSGLPGSFATKLAVTGTLVLGSGYALLGARAPGSARQPTVSSALAPEPRSARALVQSPFGPPRAYARARVGHPNRTNLSPSHHSRSRAVAVGTIAAAAPEFGPERALTARTAAHSATPAQGGNGASPAGEFGLE